MNTKVLVVVAQHYNRNELWPPLKEFKLRGYEWVTAAYEPVIIDERSKRGFRVHTTLDAIDPNDHFDALVFVSGNPNDTYAHWHDPKCNALVLNTHAHGGVLAGICASVPALGPVLKGVTVSAYPLARVREELYRAGAILSEASLSTDGNIVTAENEAMASMWTANICCRIEHEEPRYVLRQSTFKRAVRELPAIPEIEFLKRRKNDLPSE